MSRLQISHSDDLRSLRDDGYEVAIVAGHLVIAHVPYVTAAREVRYGKLISELTLSGDVTGRPDSHVVHFSGERPCDRDGRPLSKIILGGLLAHPVTSDLVIDYAFSSRPVPAGRSDDLSERIQAQRARIAELRTAQRELIRQVDPLMNERRFLAAARLLRDAVATHPGLGGPLQECEDAIRASDQLLSDARAPGLPAEKRAELYSEALRACADNEDAQSELALLSLSPVIPGPISAEGHRPRFSAHHEVQVSCPPAERGEVRIVCAGLHEQSPQSGNEFPEGGLTKYRTMARGARDMWIFEKEWLRRYTLILVLYGRCYTGGTRWYARGPEVVGLRAEHTGSSVLVTWTWPAETPDGTEISEALVAWHDGPDAGDPVNAPAQQYVSREPGTAAGRYEIPAAVRLFVRVAVAVRHEGTAYLTSGVRADARRQPMTLRYEVRQARGHRGKLLISVDGGRLDQLPALSLRGGAGRGPVTQSGGGEIALIPAGLAAREIPVKLEDPGGRRIEPQSCRLFAADDPDGGAVRIIDPARP